MEDIKKFEDFIDRMQGLLDNAKKQGHIIVRVEDLENAFPELKESEDEKIRKSLVTLLQHFCKGYRVPGLDFPVSYKDMLAWIEKQDKCKIDYPQNHQDSNCPNGSIVLEDFNGGEGFYKIHLDYLNKKQVEEIEEMIRVWNKDLKTSNENIKDCIGMCLTDVNEQRFKDYGTNLRDCLSWLEKQGEQKPTDKVEPKFHEGDWVVYECWEETATLQIKNIVDETYEFTDDSTLNVVDEDTLRLWTIQDAKDGDVLCCENGWTCIFKALSNHANTFSSYCFMDSDNWFCNTGSECHTLDKAFIKAYNGEIYPATKEQRELLFQKIHEAGYEWDAEKKELKKIEKNPTDKEMKELLHTEYEKGKADAIAEMQNAWSEEDETVLDNLIYALANDRIGNNRDEYVDWLKSIRQKLSNMERNGKNWKPSDEQIHYLSWIANIKLGDSVVEQEVSKHLNELLEDLKKLMEK